MLQTLLKIGEWQSQGKSEWDRFLDYPKVEKEDKKGNAVKNSTLPIVFDLDNHEVIIESGNLKDYEDADVSDALGTKMKGSNSKAICSSGLSKRLGRIYQTFFGKEGSNAKTGQLFEAIEKTNPELLTDDFKTLLSKLFDLKDSFLSQTVHPSKNEVDIQTINKSFDLNGNEKIVFVTIKIKSDEFGYNEPVLFSKIPAYKAYLEQSFFGKKTDKSDKKPQKKLCYASGEMLENVEELNLTTRYSLNKMFVTETKNYASFFDGNSFYLNYQVSSGKQKLLDYASNYLLEEGFTVQIANLSHVIIPQFQFKSEIDLKKALKGINQKSDLLFNVQNLVAFSSRIEDRLYNEIFWLNFLAYDSNGNYFKTTGIIKDVSSFHFSKLIEGFSDIDWDLRKATFVDWDAVMTVYDKNLNEKVRRNLNFNSIFQIIPVRKNKKNKALELFKTILENRKVNRALLYDYFVELILCHYCQRYVSYKNVQYYSKDHFSFAVRDSVFKYHAFIKLLKQLNLIDMEESIITTQEKSSNKYEKAIQEFFHEMDMLNHKDQQAMFYLGQMLNSVESLQRDKVKTVIQKVNFNGMDKDAIRRLRTDLIEKAKQYNSLKSAIFTDEKFAKVFHYNNWDMNPQEALFFLLTGYTFWLNTKKKQENETDETI